MAKVRFLETCIFEGVRYEVGTEANVNPEIASVLGSSIKVLEKDKKPAEVKPDKKANEKKADKEPAEAANVPENKQMEPETIETK